jgi:hypothetical protein
MRRCPPLRHVLPPAAYHDDFRQRCHAAAVVLLLLLCDEAVLCVHVCDSAPGALHHLVASNINLDCKVMQAPAGQEEQRDLQTDWFGSLLKGCAACMRQRLR